MEKNKIKDNSGDKKYFIITPRLVWLLSRTPYDFSFWGTVKDIAGDDGECRVTTRGLAILCMMSIGKVSDCRKYWIEKGLLIGEREKEPEERNAIWHLSIPDFWEQNIKASKEYLTIKNRIKFKEKQQIEIKKTVSPGETVTVSPGEKGSSPGEKDSSPHEIATFIEEKPLEEPKEEPAPENGAPKATPPIFPSSVDNDQKQIPTRHTSEWDMWKIEQGEPTYEKYFNRRPYFNGKDLNEFCRLRGDGATVAQITKCYEEFCGTENAYYAKRGYAFHIFAEDFNAFGNEKMKNIIAKTEHGTGKKNGSPKPNVVVEDLGELTLKRFGLA